MLVSLGGLPGLFYYCCSLFTILLLALVCAPFPKIVNLFHAEVGFVWVLIKRNKIRSPRLCLDSTPFHTIFLTRKMAFYSKNEGIPFKIDVLKVKPVAKTNYFLSHSRLHTTTLTLPHWKLCLHSLRNTVSGNISGFPNVFVYIYAKKVPFFDLVSHLLVVVLWCLTVGGILCCVCAQYSFQP